MYSYNTPAYLLSFSQNLKAFVHLFKGKSTYFTTINAIS